jgi:hypothetical protein
MPSKISRVLANMRFPTTILRVNVPTWIDSETATRRTIHTASDLLSYRHHSVTCRGNLLLHVFELSRLGRSQSLPESGALCQQGPEVGILLESSSHISSCSPIRPGDDDVIGLDISMNHRPKCG